MAIVAPLVALGALHPGPASAAPPPDPLPWTRTYIPEGESPESWTYDLFVACILDLPRGVHDNGVAGAPKIGVIGDSVDDTIRGSALADTAYRWIFATHCGENYFTTANEGRLDDVLAEAPDVLVSGIGTNNFSQNYQPVPDAFPWFEIAFEYYLDRTDDVPCRVVFNTPHQYPLVTSEQQRAVWHNLVDRANAVYGSIDPARHPNVQLVDWDAYTTAAPWLLTGEGHLTHAGINARINLALAASRRCFVPDTPTGIGAVASNGAATVWWKPLPAEEAVTSYRVTSSTGQSVTTSQSTTNVGGLTNGIPVSFTVTAENQSGTSTPSDPAPSVTPTDAGARFHPRNPVRALDTRTGTGGKDGPFWPQESFELSLAGTLPAEAANASAVVLNVTATGQTQPSFITVWPGDQTRPLTSNLNPQPGVNAIPAMVTTRAGPNATVQLFNNSGFVHLIVDVVGWYDPPGEASGALYQPVIPTRLLDTRDGTGGKATAFGAEETFSLAVDELPAGASAAVLNVTATNSTAPGFVTVYPADAPRPLASSLNPQPGLTRANLTVAQIGADRRIAIHNHSASTDLIVDVVGYYSAPGATGGGSEYFPITPERHYDTRDGTGGLRGPISNDAPTTLALHDRGSLPAAPLLTAVDANITVTDPATDGHCSLWPDGPLPPSSNLNFQDGEVVSNRTLAGLGAGTSQIWSSTPSVHYVIDVSGWFGPPIGAEESPLGALPSTEPWMPTIPSGPTTTEAPPTTPPTSSPPTSSPPTSSPPTTSPPTTDSSPTSSTSSTSWVTSMRTTRRHPARTTSG